MKLCRSISYTALGYREHMSDIMHLVDDADMHVAANTIVMPQLIFM